MSERMKKATNYRNVVIRAFSHVLVASDSSFDAAMLKFIEWGERNKTFFLPPELVSDDEDRPLNNWPD
ncbi:hypothetical protein [Entomobacter blattae]|uniref:Uncharacterized protein n=1 Tax=Entomobacter blattae TaxID=2762277 RepID=A0A7H1NUE6_9PROT|nr:hypothetical protein [Entomobacter blattae]QNT79406.1 hypothetical protein JGUZn3_22050 [Entomobacter blattae]